MTKDNKDKIIEIVSKYGFEEIPCSIPKNDFQYFKRNIYFKIYEISPKLFYFLRDRVSPIKFLKERPDGSLFYSIKENGVTKYEICIEKHPMMSTYLGETTLSIIENKKNIDDAQAQTINRSYSSDSELVDNLDKDIQNFPELKGKKRKFFLDQLC